ncbi:unnamed protein product [Paramecium primaurelia]|uniref:Transmembrane protein n=1 Tax=Paramecium primaurelia TaxID=5886 RepID=A0A8S1Q842_PARPR|nr:unnamed protein product [Paramecium primaurelia]
MQKYQVWRTLAIINFLLQIHSAFSKLNELILFTIYFSTLHQFLFLLFSKIINTPSQITKSNNQILEQNPKSFLITKENTEIFNRVKMTDLQRRRVQGRNEGKSF